MSNNKQAVGTGVGAGTGVLVGAALGGPIGAVIGGIGGGILGSAATKPKKYARSKRQYPRHRAPAVQEELLEQEEEEEAYVPNNEGALEYRGGHGGNIYLSPRRLPRGMEERVRSRPTSPRRRPEPVEEEDEEDSQYACGGSEMQYACGSEPDMQYACGGNMMYARGRNAYEEDFVEDEDDYARGGGGGQYDKYGYGYDDLPTFAPRSPRSYAASAPTRSPRARARSPRRARKTAK